MITVTQNYWRIPSVDRAFDGFLEGTVTDAERLETIAKTEAARASWMPNTEAFDLVDEIRALVGSKVKVQLWDPIMVILNEGPNPFTCILLGVELHKIDGFLQAFLQVNSVEEIPTPDGYSPLCYFQQPDNCSYLQVSLADLYQISRVSH
jgi:hypothetical protein